MIAVATLDGGDQGEEIGSCGAGAQCAAFSQAEGIGRVENGRGPRGRAREGAAGLCGGRVDYGTATPTGPGAPDDLQVRRQGTGRRRGDGIEGQVPPST